MHAVAGDGLSRAPLLWKWQNTVFEAKEHCLEKRC